MFEVGFSELCMLGLVALLVIGPEKLPKVARLAGFWIGKTRTMIASVKAEIKEELRAEEMRQLFKEQQADISKFQEILDDAANSVKLPQTKSVQNNVDRIKQPHEPE